ncbi:NUDIX domain-containing protein [Nocardia asiatica]|uniref:NUDIX domain-containing protein n=1 Tax=Nocardia asiatica TaxID=209252 RepID=UPI003EE41C68
MIEARLASLHVRTEAERLVLASLFIDKRYLDVAIVAEQPRPELLFGVREWAGFLDAMSFTRAYGNQELTVPFVRELHRRLMALTDPSSAGVFAGIALAGAQYDPLTSGHKAALDANPYVDYLDGPNWTGAPAVIFYPSFPLENPHIPGRENIESFLQALCDWYNGVRSRPGADPYAVASALQRILVSVHPFRDYNGRLSRLLMNWALENAGLPPSAVHDVNLDLMGSPQEWAAAVRAGSLRFDELWSRARRMSPEADPVALFDLDHLRQRYRQIDGRHAPFPAEANHNTPEFDQLLRDLHFDPGAGLADTSESAALGEVLEPAGQQDVAAGIEDPVRTPTDEGPVGQLMQARLDALDAVRRLQETDDPRLPAALDKLRNAESLAGELMAALLLHARWEAFLDPAEPTPMIPRQNLESMRDSAAADVERLSAEVRAALADPVFTGTVADFPGRSGVVDRVLRDIYGSHVPVPPQEAAHALPHPRKLITLMSYSQNVSLVVWQDGRTWIATTRMGLLIRFDPETYTVRRIADDEYLSTATGVFLDAHGEVFRPRGLDELLTEDDPLYPFAVMRHPGDSGDGYVAEGVWGRFGAAGVLIRHVDSDGIERFLITKSSDGYSRGSWQLPGGALMSNETPARAAARELAEELRVPPGYVEKLRLNGTPHEGRVDGAPRGWKYTSLAAEASERFTPVVDGVETAEAQWVTRDELEEMAGREQLHEGLRASLDELLARFPSSVTELALRELPDALTAFGVSHRHYADELVAQVLPGHPELRNVPLEALVGLRAYTDGVIDAITNEALLTGNPALIAPRQVIIDAVSGALQMLPAYAGTVLRGIKVALADLPGVLARYEPGEIVREPSFVSTDKFRGFDGDTLNIHFEIESRTGRDIHALSAKAHIEDEVLFAPDTRFRVVSKAEGDNGVWTIHLEEVVQPPVSDIDARPAAHAEQAKQLRLAEISRARAVTDGDHPGAVRATADVVRLLAELAEGAPHPDRPRPAPHDGAEAIRVLRDARDLGFDVEAPDVVRPGPGEVPAAAISWLAGGRAETFANSRELAAAMRSAGSDRPSGVIVTDRSGGRPFLLYHDGERIWMFDRHADSPVTEYRPNEYPAEPLRAVMLEPLDGSSTLEQRRPGLDGWPQPVSVDAGPDLPSRPARSGHLDTDLITGAAREDVPQPGSARPPGSSSGHVSSERFEGAGPRHARVPHAVPVESSRGSEPRQAEVSEPGARPAVSGHVNVEQFGGAGPRHARRPPPVPEETSVGLEGQPLGIPESSTPVSPRESLQDRYADRQRRNQDLDRALAAADRERGRLKTLRDAAVTERDAAEGRPITDARMAILDAHIADYEYAHAAHAWLSALSRERTTAEIHEVYYAHLAEREAARLSLPLERDRRLLDQLHEHRSASDQLATFLDLHDRARAEVHRLDAVLDEGLADPQVVPEHLDPSALPHDDGGAAWRVAADVTADGAVDRSPFPESVTMLTDSQLQTRARGRILRVADHDTLITRLRDMGSGASALVVDKDRVTGARRRYQLVNFEGLIIAIDRPYGLVYAFTPVTHQGLEPHAALFDRDGEHIHPIGPNDWHMLPHSEQSALPARVKTLDRISAVYLESAMALDEAAFLVSELKLKRVGDLRDASVRERLLDKLRNSAGQEVRRRRARGIRALITALERHERITADLASLRTIGHELEEAELAYEHLSAEHRRLAAELDMDRDLLTSRTLADMHAATPERELARGIEALQRSEAAMLQAERDARQFDHELSAALDARVPIYSVYLTDRGNYCLQSTIIDAMWHADTANIEPLDWDFSLEGTPDFAAAAALGARPEYFPSRAEMEDHLTALPHGAWIAVLDSGSEYAHSYRVINNHGRILVREWAGVESYSYPPKERGEVHQIRGIVYLDRNTPKLPLSDEVRVTLRDLGAQYGAARAEWHELARMFDELASAFPIELVGELTADWNSPDDIDMRAGWLRSALANSESLEGQRILARIDSLEETARRIIDADARSASINSEARRLLSLGSDGWQEGMPVTYRDAAQPRPEEEPAGGIGENRPEIEETRTPSGIPPSGPFGQNLSAPLARPDIGLPQLSEARISAVREGIHQLGAQPPGHASRETLREMLVSMLAEQQEAAIRAQEIHDQGFSTYEELKFTLGALDDRVVAIRKLLRNLGETAGMVQLSTIPVVDGQVARDVRFAERLREAMARSQPTVTVLKVPETANTVRVELLTFDDGWKTVRKLVEGDTAAAQGRRRVWSDAEELGGLVGHALRASVPFVHVVDGVVYLEFIEGPNALDAWRELAGSTRLYTADDEQIAWPYVNTLDGRLIGLLDGLIHSADRHAANWIISGPSRLFGIDHEASFLFPKRNSFFADRMRVFVSLFGPEWIDPAAPMRDFGEIRRRLDDLLPEFEARGRAEWHHQMMRLLDDIEASAVDRGRQRLDWEVERARARAAVDAAASRVSVDVLGPGIGPDDALARPEQVAEQLLALGAAPELIHELSAAVAGYHEIAARIEHADRQAAALLADLTRADAPILAAVQADRANGIELAPTYILGNPLDGVHPPDDANCAPLAGMAANDFYYFERGGRRAVDIPDVVLGLDGLPHELLEWYAGGRYEHFGDVRDGRARIARRLWAGREDLPDDWPHTEADDGIDEATKQENSMRGMIVVETRADDGSVTPAHAFFVGNHGGKLLAYDFGGRYIGEFDPRRMDPAVTSVHGVEYTRSGDPAHPLFIDADGNPVRPMDVDLDVPLPPAPPRRGPAPGDVGSLPPDEPGAAEFADGLRGDPPARAPEHLIERARPAVEEILRQDAAVAGLEWLGTGVVRVESPESGPYIAISALEGGHVTALRAAVRMFPRAFEQVSYDRAVFGHLAEDRDAVRHVLVESDGAVAFVDPIDIDTLFRLATPMDITAALVAEFVGLRQSGAIRGSIDHWIGLLRDRRTMGPLANVIVRRHWGGFTWTPDVLWRVLEYTNEHPVPAHHPAHVLRRLAILNFPLPGYPPATGVEWLHRFASKNITTETVAVKTLIFTIVVEQNLTTRRWSLNDGPAGPAQAALVRRFGGLSADSPQALARLIAKNLEGGRFANTAASVRGPLRDFGLPVAGARPDGVESPAVSDLGAAPGSAEIVRRALDAVADDIANPDGLGLPFQVESVRRFADDAAVLYGRDEQAAILVGAVEGRHAAALRELVRAHTAEFRRLQSKQGDVWHLLARPDGSRAYLDPARSDGTARLATPFDVHDALIVEYLRAMDAIDGGIDEWMMRSLPAEFFVSTETRVDGFERGRLVPDALWRALDWVEGTPPRYTPLRVLWRLSMFQNPVPPRSPAAEDGPDRRNQWVVTRTLHTRVTLERVGRWRWRLDPAGDGPAQEALVAEYGELTASSPQRLVKLLATRLEGGRLKAVLPPRAGGAQAPEPATAPVPELEHNVQQLAELVDPLLGTLPEDVVRARAELDDRLTAEIAATPVAQLLERLHDARHRGAAAEAAYREVLVQLPDEVVRLDLHNDEAGGRRIIENLRERLRGIESALSAAERGELSRTLWTDLDVLAWYGRTAPDELFRVVHRASSHVIVVVHGFSIFAVVVAVEGYHEAAELELRETERELWDGIASGRWRVDWLAVRPDESSERAVTMERIERVVSSDIAHIVPADVSRMRADAAMMRRQVAALTEALDERFRAAREQVLIRLELEKLSG